MKTLMTFALCAAAALMIAGCDQMDSTSTPDFSSPSKPGGAPSYGSPSGMGFSTGDAAQAGGQGGGLMGFHDTGKAGTSGTITQNISEAEKPKEKTEE